MFNTAFYGLFCSYTILYCTAVVCPSNQLFYLSHPFVVWATIVPIVGKIIFEKITFHNKKKKRSQGNGLK